MKTLDEVLAEFKPNKAQETKMIAAITKFIVPAILNQEIAPKGFETFLTNYAPYLLNKKNELWTEINRKEVHP